MLKRITSLMIFIAVAFGQQSTSGLELEESIIQGVLTVKSAKADSNVIQKLAIADANVVQKLAIADAKEDFNSGLKWSALSMVALIGELYLKGMWPLTFAAPIYLIQITPVDNSRLYTLYTKNKKHRMVYRKAYEKEIRKQRLKYSILGPPVGCGVLVAVLVIIL